MKISLKYINKHKNDRLNVVGVYDFSKQHQMSPLHKQPTEWLMLVYLAPIQTHIEVFEKVYVITKYIQYLEGGDRALLILQPFCHFTYVTTHSPTLLLLHLRHCSFSNPSFASPTSHALHLIHLVSRPCSYPESGFFGVNFFTFSP